MPREAQPARLWLKPAYDGRASQWLILDNGRKYRTGCAPDARREAEKKLIEYISAKHDPAPAGRSRHPSQVLIADILSVYLDEVALKQPQPLKVAARIGRLEEWWGEKRLSEVNPAACREYVKHRDRKSPKRRAEPAEGEKIFKGGSRRDLEDLRSAINHHAKRGLHRGFIEVELPEKGAPRTAWLTRSEVARLLWACWRFKREVKPPKGWRADTTDAQKKAAQRKLYDLRHLARFILMGVYTGSRSGAILTASTAAGANRSFIDLEHGVFFRLAEGKAETNKRQPPAPIPPRLLAHLRRWKAKGIIGTYVVEWEGLPIKSVKKGWKRAAALSGIDKPISPHTLRHTAATWLMQRGATTWEAAGYLGMSEQMVRDVYGHFHPDFMKNAARLISGHHGR